MPVFSARIFAAVSTPRPGDGQQGGRQVFDLRGDLGSELVDLAGEAPRQLKAAGPAQVDVNKVVLKQPADNHDWMRPQDVHYHAHAE